MDINKDIDNENQKIASTNILSNITYPVISWSFDYRTKIGFKHFHKQTFRWITCNVQHT